MGVNNQIINLIKKRLDKGQQEYNREVPIRKERGLSNIDEALDEILDLVVYLTAYILELKEDKKEKAPLKIETEEIKILLIALHSNHEESWRDNNQIHAGKVLELIEKIKKASKWTYEDDKFIGQSDMDYIAQHDPGDEDPSVRNGPTKCVQGSECD